MLPDEMCDQESRQKDEREKLRDDDEQSSVRKSDRVEQDSGHRRSDESSEGKDGRPESGDESVGVDRVRKAARDGGLVSVRESGYNLSAKSDTWKI